MKAENSEPGLRVEIRLPRHENAPAPSNQTNGM
jgi:hypothetical protein